MSETKILITREEVSEMAAISCSTIYKLMKREQFPKPIKIGRHAVRWYRSEVIAWLEERPRAVNEIRAV